MAPQGSAPFSSILYLTKRKRLTEHLYENRNDTSLSNQQYSYENIFYPSHPERSKNVGLHKNLIYLSQDRLKYEISDGVELDVDDGLNRGLNYLSQHSTLLNLNDVDDLSRNRHYGAQYQEKITGKVESIANILDLNDFSNTSTLNYSPFERHLELSDKYVGPLNVSEVGNLLALALKLQENEKLDSDLGKKLEISAHSWKNYKVPNTVPDDLIIMLFKNKPYQCETCGLRFNLNDTKMRHELTHKQKSDRFWYSLDGWIYITSNSGSFTYPRSTVTLDTFRNLFKNIPLEDENVNWLRTTLFPNEKNVKDLVLSDELVEPKEEPEQDLVPVSENLNDEATIWSWGLMDPMVDIPFLNTTEKKSEDQAVNSGFFSEMVRNVSLNLLMLTLDKPVLGSFGDISKAFCVICQDLLNCEFDVKYNKFVYVNTTSFQLDLDMISKAFQVHVPLSYILSLDNLDSLDVYELVRKMASVKVLSVETKSKRDLAITDWSFKYTRELLDMDNSLPKMEDVKYLNKLVKGWKNPFKVNNCANNRSTLYSHTSCLKLFLNSHLRLAKLKGESFDDEVVRRELNKLNTV